MSTKKHHIRAVVIVVAALLIAIPVVYAASVMIDTDDGAVDADWDTVSVTIDDGADTAANYDIVEAWVGSPEDNGALYFRVNLASSGQLPDDYSTLEARLDCNQDGDFTDAQDVVVYYALDTFLPDGEEIAECQGADYIDCDYAPEPNLSDTNPITSGEEITGTIGVPYNYEWQADVRNGTTDYSACYGTFNVQFASVDNTGTVQDITVWAEYFFGHRLFLPVVVQVSAS
jgi:hypothetical protein